MEGVELKIAVLSGKGGVGKTLAAVNLAAVAGNSLYVDCDVEEPNGHLFFKPTRIACERVSVPIPFVDDSLCNACRHCIDFCKFNALACINGKWMIFEEVCHSCGGCVMICPQQALTERSKTVGEIHYGTSGQVMVYSGMMKIGEASGVPVIKQLLAASAGAVTTTVIDCPPGSACIVMESIRDADYCVLVAEPTVFGAHNLAMVHELVKLFGKPHGVLLNKCLEGDNPSERYCRENGISILGRISFSQAIGKLNSDGKILVRESRKYHDEFSILLEIVKREARRETIACS